MPQFRPFRWINLITWTFITLGLILTFIHKVYLPRILTVKTTRIVLSS